VWLDGSCVSELGSSVILKGVGHGHPHFQLFFSALSKRYNSGFYGSSNYRITKGGMKREPNQILDLSPYN